MTEFQKMLESMMLKGLDTLSDSQFLGFVAMWIQDSNGALPDYIARRVDMIALKIQAEEVGE